MTTDCKACNYKKLIGGGAGTLVLGTALFFSCGKADDKKAADDKGDSADDVELHLTFEAYADKSVDTFRVYAGTSKDTLKQATEFTTADTDFDYAKPELVVESAGNSVLTTLLGGQGCFQLRAVKADIESDGSNLVCTDL